MLSFKNQSHIIIGLTSLVFTLCFLSYFIHKEFQDEKDAIVLEARDKMFVELFDGFDTNLNHTETHIPQYLESHTTGQRSVSIIIQDSFSNNVYDEINIPSELNINDQSNPHSFKVDMDESKGILGEGFNYERLISETIERVDNDKGKNIPNLEVIKRMVPQILISLLVLLSIFISYLLFLKQLKKEQKLSLMRNDFMSNMSHELKTPVSTISVALEALSSFHASDNRELSTEYIDISKHEIKRLGLLVDKALNISLYEQGNYIANKQIIDLNTEIASIVKILKIQHEAAQVQLHYEHSGEHLMASLDRTHIVNVIHNLIENAIKYADENPIIHITLKEQEKNLKLIIADNGIGISPEYQDKVFEKFFRVPQGNTHNTKGHGLGLSYVKEVINKHDGSIELKSQENRGSTFTILLPKSDIKND